MEVLCEQYSQDRHLLRCAHTPHLETLVQAGIDKNKVELPGLGCREEVDGLRIGHHGEAAAQVALQLLVEEG